VIAVRPDRPWRASGSSIRSPRITSITPPVGWPLKNASAVVVGFEAAGAATAPCFAPAQDVLAEVETSMGDDSAMQAGRIGEPGSVP